MPELTLANTYATMAESLLELATRSRLLAATVNQLPPSRLRSTLTQELSIICDALRNMTIITKETLT